MTTALCKRVCCRVCRCAHAEELSRRLSRNVIDRTGLEGEYDFELRWAPDAADGDSAPDGPSIFTAVQEQLGLKLESGKAPVGETER